MLGLAGNEILFVEDGFGLAVIHAQGGVDLAAALDGLLVELIAAALGAIEGGLKAIGDVEDEIDGAGSVGVGADALAIAGLLKMQDRGSGRKDAPIDCVGERLFLREAEACAGRSKGGNLLPEDESRRKGEKEKCCSGTRLQRGLAPYRFDCLIAGTLTASDEPTHRPWAARKTGKDKAALPLAKHCTRDA